MVVVSPKDGPRVVPRQDHLRPGIRAQRPRAALAAPRSSQRWLEWPARFLGKMLADLQDQHGTTAAGETQGAQVARRAVGMAAAVAAAAVTGRWETGAQRPADAEPTSAQHRRQMKPRNDDAHCRTKANGDWGRPSVEVDEVANSIPFWARELHVEASGDTHGRCAPTSGEKSSARR